jgi:hypothetical protein
MSMLNIVKNGLYIKHLASYVDHHFATKSFKPFYFPYAKSYFKMNVQKLSPMLNLLRGV